jgi:uncharacterized protein (TIGR02246 family)
MRNRLLWWLALPALVLSITVGSVSAAQPEDKAKDEAAIQKNGEAFVEALHKGDSKAMAAFWASDGDFTDMAGHQVKGREAIEKALAAAFAEHKGLKVRVESLSLRFVTPEVAIEDGTTEAVPAKGGPPSQTRYTIVHVKKDGQWLVSSLRNSPYIPPSNYQHLRKLEGLIGNWAGATDTGEVERISLAWANNQNFIVGTFSTSARDVSVGSAKQWIGWDPLAKCVRTWIFDETGGFGEGSWTEDGKKWIFKASSVLQNGKKATTTLVIGAVDANTITLQARDRSVDGAALPETKEIKLKRVK